ncbi:alpha/beta hydrolase [soil metagenome]
MSRTSDARTTIRGVEMAHRVARVPGRPWFVWGHGLTSSMADDDELGLIDWTRTADVASVLRYDARGHGSTGSSSDLAGYHWRSLADDQLVLADHLGIDRYVAGGASMGCATALYAALAAPHRIMALVLAIPPTAWETRAAQIEGYELSARLVEAGEIDLLVAGAAERPPPDPFVGMPGWRDRFGQMARATAPDRLARVLRGAGATDLPSTDALASISVPTIVLAWTGDAGHPVSTAERLAELIPAARLHVASTLDQLTGWTDLVIEFVDGVADTTSG